MRKFKIAESFSRDKAPAADDVEIARGIVKNNETMFWIVRTAASVVCHIKDKPVRDKVLAAKLTLLVERLKEVGVIQSHA